MGMETVQRLRLRLDVLRRVLHSAAAQDARSRSAHRGMDGDWRCLGRGIVVSWQREAGGCSMTAYTFILLFGLIAGLLLGWGIFGD